MMQLRNSWLSISVYCKSLTVILRGLRTIFDETHPDPLRIVCVNESVEELLQHLENDEGYKHSVEFYGGTHLFRSWHIADFDIVTEEAIAKGIRRIVALTGPEAKAALSRSELYIKKVERIEVECCEAVNRKW